MRVRQVLANYLSNALKFTERGSVTLHAGPAAGGALRFEVRDSGPGITAEVRARLFQPFVQADQSTTRRFGGSGLGLSICHELAALMGGHVGVDSTPGEGSRFWAELPLPAAEAPARDATAGAPEHSPLAGARVLMVEDNPVNMTIAVAMLEQWGVQVEQASDGRQAIAAVERAEHAGRPLDAVLMDVQMPVMSGYEATRALRERAGSRRLPIIALTAAALSSEREQALASRHGRFLTKPIDMHKLHAALMAALAARRNIGDPCHPAVLHRPRGRPDEPTPPPAAAGRLGYRAPPDRRRLLRHGCGGGRRSRCSSSRCPARSMPARVPVPRSPSSPSPRCAPACGSAAAPRAWRA